MESKFNYKNFSIVIPIYNEEEILEESTNAIFSLCKRMEIDFEIIFSENGSTDKTKAIAEELRGLAVEFDIPSFSATQTTRSGYSNSDIGLEDTSESFGLPATADLMFALISTEELDQQGQFMVKQLKNRYNDPTIHKRFVIGVDRSKMRLFDVEETEQTLTDDTPVFDKTDTGKRFKDFKL
mgnify:CR=1 FL=1